MEIRLKCRSFRYPGGSRTVRVQTRQQAQTKVQPEAQPEAQPMAQPMPQPMAQPEAGTIRGAVNSAVGIYVLLTGGAGLRPAHVHHGHG